MDDNLPLLSNVKDILVRHYSFDFTCNFVKKIFECSVILFLETNLTNGDQILECVCSPYGIISNDPHCTLRERFDNSSSFSGKCSMSNEYGFILILDCHKIKVNNIAIVNISSDEFESLKFSGCDFSVNIGSDLSFQVDEWCLKIWCYSKTCKFCFPKTIKISYETLPFTPSLLWVKDQDKKDAVFTYGAAVNNRSLFPCQEPPTAMATWEASVAVSDSAIVLMSGDEEPLISYTGELTQFYYFTKKCLPLSTLCLAIGYWEEHVITKTYESCPKCKIFAPSSMIDKSIQELFEYIPYCLKISEDMLGPYPFPRIDFLIVPPTFGSLGMASPNLIFLSQSLLVGDGSMCSRVSHEIAHGWFGLLIGALDWTEEWLSEGFATFVEDYFHTFVINMDDYYRSEYIELRSFIRRKTLLDEIENTESELQIMRASQGKVDEKVIDGVDATVLKNGQNPLKGFLQVHYIKGYFLLKHLSDKVGINNFINFLCAYIEKYAGHLVTSEEFLTMYFSFFPSLNGILTLDSIYKDWLHNPGIPNVVETATISPQNKLFSEVAEETKKWTHFNKALLKKHSKRRKLCLDHFTSLTMEQIILMLENILEFEVVAFQTLTSLNEVYNFKKLNPEIQHRWFELVIKFKYRREYNALREFLSNHLAMGVYLYNEMIFSSNTLLKNIAQEVYHALETEMEPNYRTTILHMLQDCDQE